MNRCAKQSSGPGSYLNFYGRRSYPVTETCQRVPGYVSLPARSSKDAEWSVKAFTERNPVGSFEKICITPERKLKEMPALQRALIVTLLEMRNRSIGLQVLPAKEKGALLIGRFALSFCGQDIGTCSLSAYKDLVLNVPGRRSTFWNLYYRTTRIFLLNRVPREEKTPHLW